MYKIFDIHTHTYPEKIADRAVESLEKFYDFYGDYGFAVAGKGTYADLSSMAEENNVVGYLLFSVATNPTQVEKVNDSIASLAKKSREEGFQTVGFLGMHQDYPDFEKELIRCEDMGLCGVKIHPDIQRFDLLDERFYKICEIAEGRLALCLHIGDSREEYQYSSPLKLKKVLDDFPKLKVIAAHLGGYMNWSVAKEHLWNRENLWYDLSSVLWSEIDRKLLHECIRDFAPDRVMFGSDYPVSKPDNYLKLFDKLDLDDTLREKILYKNAYSFLDK